MTRKEHRTITKQKLRKSESVEEYSKAMLTHFTKYIKPLPPTPKVDPSLIFDGKLL
jgi:hypothetical protein